MTHLVLVAALALLQQGAAAPPDGLTPAQRAVLERGEQVVITTEVPGTPWPRVRVVQLVDATPEEAAAVLADYERQVSYVPNVKKSRIVARPDARTTDVEFAVTVPMFPDEEYAVRERVSRTADGSGYRVEWRLLRASSIKATEGGATFTPYGSATRAGRATLMTYDNYVVPGSRLGGIGFVKNRALRDVRVVALAIRREIERERREDAALLRRQVGALRAMLGP